MPENELCGDCWIATSTVTPPNLKETCTTEAPKEQMDRAAGSEDQLRHRTIGQTQSGGGDTFFIVVSPALCSLGRKDIEELLNQQMLLTNTKSSPGNGVQCLSARGQCRQGDSIGRRLDWRLCSRKGEALSTF